MQPIRNLEDSLTSAQIRKLAIERKALFLRQQGGQFDYIAECLNEHFGTAMDEAMAAKAVRAGLRKWRGDCKESAKEIIEMDNLRLDQMIEVCMGQARAGNLDAINTALRVQKRRAELLGLDAAIKAEIEIVQPSINPRKLSVEQLQQLRGLVALAGNGGEGEEGGDGDEGVYDGDGLSL